jgi:hypothetical protein
LKKYQTIDEVEKTKAKAVAFAENVLQDDEKASDLEAESPESYAERKRIVIVDNPLQRRKANVANGNGLTKADLTDIIDQVTQVLQDAYAPESSREELASAVGDALDILGGDGDDDDDDADDGSDDSDDDGGSE